jgi:DNA polymerase epsilon subunit 1
MTPPLSPLQPQLDGPYRCMVLPSSTDEGRLLKKRYAVFNDDGSLAELKGFELKRRGELEVVKIFQSQVFECFLKGDGLQGCYEAVAEVANHWLDVLDSEGEDLDDEELLELISENKTISQTLAEYGDQKSTSLTTARRIAEFLGDEMVKDRGLNCRLIICNRPAGAPVTERAVPTHIFSAEDKVKKHFVRKWLKDPAMEDFDIRSLLDWGYYRERLGKSIQKIITIPAAMQKITNPVPRIPHPDWLQRIVREKNDKYKQRKIDTMFSLAPPPRSAAGVGDLEDIAGRVPGKVAGLMQSRKHNLVLEATAEAGTGSTQAPSAMEVSSETGAKFPITTPTPVPEGASPGELATWLSEQKGIWKAQRIKRRTASKVQSAVTQTGDKGDKRRRGVTMGSGGVAGYLRAAEEALIHGVWQILSISPAPTAPGQYTAWVMTGPRELNRVTLEIPRTFYVNARKLPERLPDGMRRVKWELPRGRERLDLLQVSSYYTYVYII